MSCLVGQVEFFSYVRCQVCIYQLNGDIYIYTSGKFRYEKSVLVPLDQEWLTSLALLSASVA